MLGSQLSESKMRKISMPCAGGFVDESGDHVVGISGVADRVRAAQQHLETDVRDGLAEVAQARERVLVEKAHGDVEGRAAPHFQAEEIVQRGARRSCAIGQHVVGADARGEQRLVRVAEGGVGEQQAAFVCAVHSANFFGPSSSSSWRVPSRRRDGVVRRDRRREQGAVGHGLAGDVRVAVDDHVAEISQQLGGAVAARREAEQLRRLVRASVVVAWPAWKSAWLTTFSRNGMFVLTPRTRNSRSARSMRWQACRNSRPQAVIFTSRES